ncbi:hypothetical protein PSACC_00628, partial [Paramicrosporidium saccamoebae]
MRLPTLTLQALCVFTVSKHCSASYDFRSQYCCQLKHHVPLNLSDLNSELRTARTEGKNSLDIWNAAWSDQIDELNLLEVVKEALRGRYYLVLHFAQRPGLLGWKHLRDYHLFYALSYGESWFDEKLWEGTVLDWETHLEEVLRADNVECFKHVFRNYDLFPLPQEQLEKLGAAKIMAHLGITIDVKDLTARRLIASGHVNTLKCLHNTGVDIFIDPDAFSGITDPDILDFLLYVRPEIVDIPKVIHEAVARNRVDTLKVIYHHKREIALDQGHFTVAASGGCLKVLLWMHSAAPTLRPTKDCLPNIMVYGHAKVFDFCYSLDPTFLPEPYMEEIADFKTIWHLDMAAKIYAISPELVSLEKLCQHALALHHHELAAWAKKTIFECASNVEMNITATVFAIIAAFAAGLATAIVSIETLWERQGWLPGIKFVLGLVVLFSGLVAAANAAGWAFAVGGVLVLAALVILWLLQAS